MSFTNTVWTTAAVEETLQKLRYGAEADMSCFYERRANLKAANVTFQLTFQEVEEFNRCSADIVYFVEKYCKFLTDKGQHLVNLRSYQNEILKMIGEEIWLEEIEDFGPKNRNAIVMSARQSGKCFSINTKSLIKNAKTGKIQQIYLPLLYYLYKDKLTFLEKIKVKLFLIYIKINK